MLQLCHFSRTVVGQSGLLRRHPSENRAQWRPVSVDPTEQQRVMLLSRSPSGPKKYFPIPVGHLEEEIRIRSADDCKRFREEFNVSLKPLCLTVWEGAGVRDVVFQDKLAPRLRTLASTVTLSPSEYQGNPLSTAVPCH